MSGRRKDRIVYKVTNRLNGKVYIGFCVDFKERKARHLRCVERGQKTKFYNAIRKYGKTSFVWDVLYDKISDMDKCKEIEIEMIKEHNSYNLGYNSTFGGDGGFTGYNSGMFKKGQKTWCDGKKLSQEHIQKLRESHIGIKQDEAQKQKRASKLYKPVVQYDLNGNFIMNHISIMHASKHTGVHKIYIGQVCRGKWKTAGNFKWEFKNKNI